MHVLRSQCFFLLLKSLWHRLQLLCYLCSYFIHFINRAFATQERYFNLLLHVLGQICCCMHLREGFCRKQNKTPEKSENTESAYSMTSINYWQSSTSIEIFDQKYVCCFTEVVMLLFTKLLKILVDWTNSQPSLMIAITYVWSSYKFGHSLNLLKLPLSKFKTAFKINNEKDRM